MTDSNKFPVNYELTEHAKVRIIERKISLNWIETTLSAPQRIEFDQKDPTLRHAFAVIPECDNRVLRVIYNGTTTPNKIVSVYFDRKLRGKL
jgi:hypothetical protein